MPVTYANSLDLEYALDTLEVGRTPRYSVDPLNVSRVARRPFAVSGAYVDFPIEVNSVDADTSINAQASVSVLLQRYLSAYKLVGAVDTTKDEVTKPPRWKRDAADELDRTAARLGDDRPIAAEFAFLAAVDEATVASFLSRARNLLKDASTTRPNWEAFVDGEAGAAMEQTAHEPLAPLPESNELAVQESLDADLLSIADLRGRVHRGALRGRRALVDTLDA